ncbi:MAG: tetratricopeptide repeat protein, partial [Candidatus Omnitrophica bacterium]|nr:tetratricopeptide repeat protein [Candidatus Omnitrophota bacterium]
QEAVKQYEGIIKSEVKRPEIFFSLAQAYLNEKEYAKAMDVFQKAVALAPKNTSDISKVGDAFASRKMYQEALEVYSTILKVNPSESKAYYKIGLCFKDLQNPAKAKEAFLRGLRVDPTSSILKKEIKRIDEKRK